MQDLENEARGLMKKGIYDPNELFNIIYHRHPVHYNLVREAIHLAKQKGIGNGNRSTY
jgi:hypothetical protein